MKEEVDRQRRRPFWMWKKAGPLPAGEGKSTSPDLKRGLERVDTF